MKRVPCRHCKKGFLGWAKDFMILRSPLKDERAHTVVPPFVSADLSCRLNKIGMFVVRCPSCHETEFLLTVSAPDLTPKVKEAILEML